MIKVGDKIRKYTIELSTDGKVKKDVIERQVVACKDYKRGKKEGQLMVIDSYSSYIILQTIDETYTSNSILSKVKVWEMKYSSSRLEDYVQAYVYTTQNNDKKIYTKLKQQIKKYLENNYGRYGNYIELLDKIEI